VLLDDDGRQAFFARDAADGRQQLLHDDRRQPFEGFVQQQQRRIQHQGTTDCQHLLFAPRQLRAQIALALGQPAEHLVHPGRRPLAGPRHGSQVFMDRE